MINQVTRALSALFRPIASRQSSEDRDPTGNAYENLPEKKKDKDHESTEEAAPPPAEASTDTPENAPVALATVTSIVEAVKTPGPSEDELERRKKAIANSQAWVGLVAELEERKASQGEQAKAGGTGVYEKANTGTSRAARTKKGVILDKKAA